jgi:cysteine-rich repeat protein
MIGFTAYQVDNNVGFSCIDGPKPPVCGNGIHEPGEECDDGNTDDGDGCSSNCEIEIPDCGNGVLEFGEECDDGEANSDTQPDACRTNCMLPYCGDDVTDTGEECDDGNFNNNDACIFCEDAECGDGFLWIGIEECDDGNNNDGDGCSAQCTIEIPICGNNVLEPGEECDDGNNDDGDGCAADCTREPCECDGGIKIIELQTTLPYTGGTVEIEARAAKKDKLDYPSDKDFYGIDSVIFDGTPYNLYTTTDSGAVEITSIESSNGYAVITFVVDVTKIGKDKLAADSDFRVTLNGQSNEVRIHTSCSKPIGPPFMFGDFNLISFTDKYDNVCYYNI